MLTKEQEKFIKWYSSKIDKQKDPEAWFGNWRPNPYILRRETCPKCEGTGLAKASKKIPCIWCNGTGIKECEK